MSEVLAGDAGIHRVVGDLPEEAAVPLLSPGLWGALTPLSDHALRRLRLHIRQLSGGYLHSQEELAV